MDFRTTPSIVSFPVSYPWEMSDESRLHCAQLSTVPIHRKRRRSSSQTRDRHAVVLILTVWSIATAEGLSMNGCSFSKVYTAKKKIAAKGGLCKILSTSTALEESSQQTFTWFAVSLEGETNHGVFLARVGKNGFETERIVPLTETPLQAVILRGPCILVRKRSEISFHDPNEAETVPLISVQNAAQSVICQTDRDTDALLMSITAGDKGSRVARLRAVTHDGHSKDFWKSSESVNHAPAIMTGSFCSGIVATACTKANAITVYDLRTGKLLRKGSTPHGSGSIGWMSLVNKSLLLKFEEGTHMFIAKSEESGKAEDLLLRLQPFFSEECRPGVASDHGHLYTQRQNVVAQVNDVTGKCCQAHEVQSGDTSGGASKKRSSSLSLFTSNLEQRVKTGVYDLLAAAGRLEDKNHMLGHVRKLVLEATNGVPRKSGHMKFDPPLENLILLPERRTPIADILNREPAKPDSGDHVESSSVANDLRRACSDQFARLLKAQYGVDSSQHFLIILVHLKLLPHMKIGAKDKKTKVHLEILVNENIDVAWNVGTYEVQADEENFWLDAHASLAAFTATNRLAHLQVSVRLASENGHSQNLGNFQVLNALSCIIDDKQIEIARNKHSHSLVREIGVIAEGTGAHKLQCLSPVPTSPMVEAKLAAARENLAVIVIKAKTGTGLAMTVARLRSNANDAVKFRYSSEVTSSSVCTLDNALISLEADMREARDLEAQCETTSELEDITRNLERQIVADEDFGALEEWMLGM